MENSIIFRYLQKKDIVEVLDIYNFHIKNGINNFEEELLSHDNFFKKCSKILKNKLPFIVCLKKEKIIGFSFLSSFRKKSGYRFAFENSVYVHNNFLGRGIGYELLKRLILASKENPNIKTIIAVIANNSIASIKIHKKNGFNMIGTLKKVGYKKKQWLDAIYLQIIL